MRIGSGNGDDLDTLASAWVIRSAERQLTPSEQDDLDNWLARDSRHLGAFVRAEAMWIDLNRVAAIGAGSRIDFPLPVTAPRGETQTRPYWRYALAASLLFVLLIGITAYSQLDGRITTDKGEIRHIALADGSRITLNGDSVVQIRYEPGRRRVVLRKGEAIFTVAHDTSRPFIVEANDVKVRAVGTEFLVGMENDEVAVTVTEGKVKVTPGDAANPARVLMSDQQIVATRRGLRRTALRAEEIKRDLAWRTGLLIFNAETLQNAAMQVNRYTQTQIIIDDPTLGRAEFTGVFHIGDARNFAKAAAHAFNADVVESGETLHLKRRSNSPSH